MTRFSGYAYRGTHVALPLAPAPLSQNYLTDGLESAGVGALVATTVTSLFKRGSFLTLLVRRSALFTLVTIPYYIAKPRLVKRQIELRGESITKNDLPFVQDLFTKVEEDDLVMGGLALGLLAAASPRLPSVTVYGWKRFLGFGTFGAALVPHLALPFYPGLTEAGRKHGVAVGESTRWLLSKPVSLNFPGGAISASASAKVASTGRNRSTSSPAQSGEAPSGDGSTPAGLLQSPEPRSVQMPHLVLDDAFGQAMPVPKTDYSWSPDSISEGIQVLQKHISNLIEKREEYRAVSNYLWMAISAKEAEYYVCQDPQTKVELKEYLENLNDMHVKTFLLMANVSWMMADSHKNLKQIDGLGDEDADVETKRTRASKTHEDIVASVCKTPQAKMETVQAGMQWANTQATQIQAQLNQLPELVKELQRANPAMQKLDAAGIEALTGPDTPGGKMLTAVQKLHEQATEELGKLREEHWNNK